MKRRVLRNADNYSSTAATREASIVTTHHGA